MNLRDQVAVVTGASMGLGVPSGWRSPGKELRSSARRVENLSSRASSRRCDLTHRGRPYSRPMSLIRRRSRDCSKRLANGMRASICS